MVATAGDYGPARARQLGLFLWLTVGAATLTTLVAAAVLLQGVLRFGLVLALPAVAALVAAALALTRVRADRRAKPYAATAGVSLVLVGVVTATLAFGFIPIIIGLLTTMLALLPEPAEG